MKNNWAMCSFTFLCLQVLLSCEY